MMWFLEKVHRALPVFRPDFGYADVRYSAFKHMGDDPRRRVWPVLLYGPELVAKLGGRQRVLETPAFRADGLEDG